MEHWFNCREKYISLLFSWWDKFARTTTPTIPANSRTTWINDFQCSHACVRLTICYADIRYNESFYLLLCSSMCVFHSTVFNVDREIGCYREYVQCRVYLRRHQKERIRNQNIKCVCAVVCSIASFEFGFVADKHQWIDRKASYFAILH